MIMAGLAVWRVVLVLMNRGYRELVMMLVTRPGGRWSWQAWLQGVCYDVDEQGLQGVSQDDGDFGKEEMIMGGLAVKRVGLVLMNRGYRGWVMLLVTRPGRRCSCWVSWGLFWGNFVMYWVV